MKPIIEVEDLSFSYHNTKVLSNVTFQVFPGQFIGLIGPNGGGKTTLLKLMMGFLKPTQGKIFLSKEDKLGYVPQTTRYDRDFPISVIEVVLSGLLYNLPWYGYFYQKDKLAAMEMLDKVGLKEYANRPFGTLSGGQAQRVLIARALVSNPKILFLDEPTASIDSKAEADIYALLNQLKGKMTILMVTHDLNAAVEQVELLFYVQGRVVPLKPEEVCAHFAMGLYHTPGEK